MKEIDSANVKSEQARLKGNESFKEGNLGECLKHYLHSLKLNKNNIKTLNNLGVVYEQTERLQEAVEYYRKSCIIIGTPSTETVKHFENLARACEALGDKTISLWAYEKALDASSENRYNIAIRYLEAVGRTHYSCADKKTIDTLEKLAEIPNIDRQLLSNEYFKVISLDQDFSKPGSPLEIISTLKKYKLAIPFLASFLNVNSLIEQKLSSLANELQKLASKNILSTEHAKIFNVLKLQSCLSGGIQILATDKDNSYGKVINLLNANCITTATHAISKFNTHIQPLKKPAHPIPKDALRRFYEANPYPFWESRPHHTPVKLAEYFHRLGIDSSKMSSHNNRILIAGCGTGRHAIQLALSYPDTQVIGIDVSLSSLRYANRQKDLLEVKNIKFLHCSIFDVARLKLKFKVIECIGVIHHLRKKTLALNALLSALDNNGLMKLGLYSKQARAPLQAVKTLCQAKAIPYKPENISLIRDTIINSSDPVFSTILNSSDFYSRQGCMDLLFNPYEDPFTIRRIYNMTLTHKLDFCGFDCRTTSISTPTFIRFDENPNLKKLLTQWHAFEKSNPKTFSEMYLFWVRPRKNS